VKQNIFTDYFIFENIINYGLKNAKMYAPQHI